MENIYTDKVVEIYGFWYEDNGKKIIEVKEKFIPKYIEEDDIGAYIMFDSEFVNDIDMVINWEVFDKPFSDRILEAVNEADVNEDLKSSILSSILQIEKYLWKFEYKERLEFIFDNVQAFQKTHNAGIGKALEQVTKIFEDVEAKYSKDKRLK